MAEKEGNDKWTPDETPEDERPDRDLDLDEAKTRKSDRVGDYPLGFVEVDTGTNQIEGNPLDADAGSQSITIGTNDDLIMDQIDDFTDDPDILEDFAERQSTNAGSDQLLEDLTQHHSRTPDLSGDDIDADWQMADQSGEETVGGSVPTPDQDIVEELGEAVGIEYEYDEELGTVDKLVERDLDRWELNPESADEEQEELWSEDFEEEEEDDEFDELDDETRDILDDKF